MSERNLARAASPLERERTATMSLLAPKRRNVRLAVKPRPVFAPVTRMVLPTNKI